MSSEFERIGLIEAILSRPSRNIALGIGDDCAVLEPASFPRVWTVDAAVDGVHFSRAWMTFEQIGYRAFMAATSDIAAMGARAVAALSALTLPAWLDDDALCDLARGLARAADVCECAIAGGNLARSELLTLTTSVLGECPKRVIARSGARPGDGIYVTGPLGMAALGLRALERGQRDDARLQAFVQRFLEPRARLDVALAVADVASSAIDVSDGLAQDLGHLTRASRVGATIELAHLPHYGELTQSGAVLGLAAHALVLGGGEDYELLFTSSAQVEPLLATRIGTIESDLALRAIDERGVELPLAPGFDHFKAP